MKLALLGWTIPFLLRHHFNSPQKKCCPCGLSEDTGNLQINMNVAGALRSTSHFAEALCCP